MALAVVQSVGAHAKSATSVTTAAITTTSGHGVVITAVVDVGFGTPEVSDSKGNTWTQAGTDQGNAAQDFLAQWYNLNIVGGASHTFTVNASSAGFPSIAVTEFSGQDTAGFDQTAGNTESASITTHTSPSVTTTAANEILFGSYSDGSTAETLAVAGGYTAGYLLDGTATAACIGHEYQIVSATGAYTSNFTTAAAETGVNIIGTYKAAAAGAPPFTPALMLLGVGVQD